MVQPSQDRRALLLISCHSFCTALVSHPSPKALLTTHFHSFPRITEHGPTSSRSLLPFLAKTFAGLDECEEYFTLLSQTLRMQLAEDAFPSKGSGKWLVDPGAENGKGVVHQDRHQLGRGVHLQA